MRFRRASVTSSASATPVLPFPWFWKSINRLSLKITGHECIPRTMLGDREALMIQEKLHDERVMATGLRGYDRLCKKTLKVEGNQDKNHDSVGGRIDNQNISDRRQDFTRRKSYSTGNLPTSCKVLFPAKEKGTANMFAWKRTQRSGTSLSNVSESSGGVSENDSSVQTCNLKPGDDSEHAQLGNSAELPNVDDGSKCTVCRKKFKFGKRWKHHCSRCMATFCHKHGRTTHNNFTSCKVPGDCLCSPCVEILRERGAFSRRESSDPN